MRVCIYVPDSLENDCVIEPKCTEFRYEKVHIWPHRVKSEPLGPQIFSSWFGKLRIKVISLIRGKPSPS